MSDNIEKCLQIQVWSIIQMITTTYKNIEKYKENFQLKSRVLWL